MYSINQHKNTKSNGSNVPAHYHKSEQLHQHAHLAMPAFSYPQSLKVRLLVQLQTYTQDATTEVCALEAMPALSQTQPAGNFMLSVEPDTSISQLLNQISSRKAGLKCTYLLVEGIFEVDASDMVRDSLTDMQRVTVLATNAQIKKKNKKSQKPPQIQPIQEASQPNKRQKLNNKQSLQKTLEYSDIEELNSSLSSEIESDIKLPATPVNTTTSAKNHKKQPTQQKQTKQAAPVVAPEVKETKNQKKKRERKEKAKLEAKQNKQKSESLSSNGLTSEDQKEDKASEKKHAKQEQKKDKKQVLHEKRCAHFNKDSDKMLKCFYSGLQKQVAENKNQKLSSNLSDDEDQASKQSSFIEIIAKSINSYDLVKAHSDVESQRRSSGSASELEVSLKKPATKVEADDEQSNKSSYNFSSDNDDLPQQKHSDDLDEASYQSSLESNKKQNKVKTLAQKSTTQTPEKKSNKHNSLSSDLEDQGEFDEFLKLDKNKNKTTKAQSSKNSSAAKPNDKKQQKYPNLF